MADITDWFVPPSPFCLPMLINRLHPQIIIRVTIDSDDDNVTNGSGFDYTPPLANNRNSNPHSSPFPHSPSLSISP